MNIYKSRYINALKKAAKVNRLIKKGYHVFHDGSPAGGKFILRDNDIIFKHDGSSGTCYFANNPDWDEGYWTKISEWNKRLNESFEVYIPNARIIL
jgi:hypothetical protein